MKQLELFEPVKTKEPRPRLPEIYVYENLNINQKINFRSAPMNLYGACKENISANLLREKSSKVYGLNRTYLDYSIAPNKDSRK